MPNEQGNPDRLPDINQMKTAEAKRSAPSSARNDAESSRGSKDAGRSHEDRENPRDDHPTGHLGYNRTHNEDVLGPVEEGSSKI